MDNNEIELVGLPCGFHGPYTFYKAFKYSKNGTVRILSLSEFFFVKLWTDSDLVSIGELQLLWVDKNSEQMLASLRLYFLPENTPDGRLDHGEDEVIAISEKVVLRVEDLLTWITPDTEWNWGRSSIWAQRVASPHSSAVYKTEEQDPLADCKDPLALTDLKDPLADCKDPLSDVKPFVCTRRTAPALTDSLLDFSDVEKERSTLDDSWTKGVGVMVLSYPRYCRYRALMKRLETVEDKWLKNSLVSALGGFTSPCRETRVLFCKDTFDYPDLEGHELLCNHLAPKLKGRPRGKRKKRSISPGGSESNESESSLTLVAANLRTRLTTAGGRNGLRCNSTTSPRRSTRSTQSSEEKDFLAKLTAYMKAVWTPIGRLPSLGFKQIDLFQFYTKVQRLGGYDKVTENRMWKVIFDELGGHQGSTSAATTTRRHYERLLLSYERSVKTEEHKPTPAAERRRLKNKTASSSEAENSEGCSSDQGSVNRQTIIATPSTSTAFISSTKVFTVPEKSKTDGKTSSLRSVRVKTDRLRDASKQEKSPSSSTSTTPTIFSIPSPISRQSKPIIVSPTTPSCSSAAFLPPPTVPISIPSTTAPKDPSAITADQPAMENVSTPPHVSPSSRENIALTNKENISQNVEITTHTIDDDDDEPIEVPYKPKTPEIIDLEDDSQPSPINPPIPEMKKRKLDILKEGGLEVTAVSSALDVPNLITDGRPSVIHHFNVPEEPRRPVGRVSITVSSDLGRMLPPAPGIRPPSRHLPPPDTLTHQRRNVNHPLLPKPSYPSPTNLNTQQYQTGQLPPRVIQSRSIYSHSEKTVYGNPKETVMPPPSIPLIPRQMIPIVAKPSGGEVLDLTVKSPQKPVVEIMRVPSVPLAASRAPNKDHTSFSKSPVSGLPMIDGRVVGSNLEITLVGGPKNALKMHPLPQKIPIPATNHRPTQKRSSTGKFVSAKPMMLMPERHENGKTMNHHGGVHSPRNVHKNGSTSSSANLIIPTPPQSSVRGHKPEESAKLKQPVPQSTSPSPFLRAAAPIYPNYLSQLSAASKNPFLPMLDASLYYSALAQGLYSPNPLQMATAPPIFPQTPTAEQLQLYKELLTHNNRIRFPVPPLLQDGPLTPVGQTSNNNAKN